MYTLDNESADEVVELAEAPQSSPGAPLPRVLASESRVILAYVAFEREPWARAMSPEEVETWYARTGERVALLTFPLVAFQLGPPNDEAIAGHPLSDRGLRPNGAFEVRRSTWLRQMERANAVHSHHDSGHYAALRHFIFTFHDSTFECVAPHFAVVECRLASDSTLITEMQRLLEHGAPAV